MEPMVVNEMKDISLYKNTTTTKNIPLLLEILDPLYNEIRVLLHYGSITAPSNWESLLLFRIKMKI
jgi:hypothetical protein